MKREKRSVKKNIFNESEATRAARAPPIKTGHKLALQVLGRAARKNALRTFGEASEIGFPFFIECVPPFLSFFCHIKKHRGIAGKFLKPCLPIAICVQGGFQAADGDRRMLEDFTAPLNGRLFELLIGNNAIDESHFQSLSRVILTAKEPDFPRFFLSYDPRKERRSITAIE